MKTGSTTYLVRRGFSECDVWRKALGNDERLLAFAAHGECLDAPEWIPSGCASNLPAGEVVSRKWL